MAGPQTQSGRIIACDRLSEDPEHDPAERVSAEHEAGENTRAKTKLVFRLVAEQHREHRRHARGKQNHHAEMGGHARLRPRARSNASSATSTFNRPATIRNVLPYS